MTVKRIKSLGRFRAVSNSGNEYEVIEYQDVIDAGTLADPNAELPGLRSFRTADGRAVNFRGGNSFEIVDVSPIHIERVS